MTPNDFFVYRLHKKENELRRICGHFKMFGYKADDIIQDLYVKLLVLNNIDRYETNDEPNMSAVFVIIRNLIFDNRKKESKYIQKELYDFCEIEEPNEKQILFESLLNEIEDMSEDTEWFEKTVLRYYVDDGHTIRSLAKDTGLSFATIQPIVHNFKIKCKEKIKKGEL